MKRGGQLKRSQMNRGKGFKSRGKGLRAKRTVDGDSAKEVKRECDQLVRDIIKLRDVSCITCNLPNEAHVGHLFRRGIETLRWNLANCNRQCDKCNGIHEEHPEHYIAAFKSRYGPAAFTVLEIGSHTSVKFSYLKLLGIRDGLRAELETARNSA